MSKLIIAALSLCLGLAGAAGAVTAQEKGVEGIYTNADGSYVTSTAGVNPSANGGGGTIVYGDINTGPGGTIIDPPVLVNTVPPPETAPAPVAAAPEPAPAAAAPAPEAAVATETDLDADNYPDALEWDLGLDGNNPDSDADGTADGDELNIYGTDPLVFDTDGDGISDGEELFGILSDPLVWNDFSAPAETSQAVAQEAAPAAVGGTESLTQDATENVTATDGDAAAMGPGSASAAPGTVTRGSGSGMALLGPDGTYSVTENAPPVVNVSGDTDVLEVIPAGSAPASTVSTATCESYGTWLDMQTAYEAAGMTAADPALVQSLDPDYDGIACEEWM